MSRVSTVASRRSYLSLNLCGWVGRPASPKLDQCFKHRLIAMRLRREAREEAGTAGCPNLYRLSSRRRRLQQRTVEQRGMAHWFASKRIEYTPQVRHMLSPIHTPADELAQMHLSDCLIRNPVIVGLESQCKHGGMVVAI